MEFLNNIAFMFVRSRQSFESDHVFRFTKHLFTKIKVLDYRADKKKNNVILLI